MNAEILTKLKQIPLFETIRNNEDYLRELGGIGKLRSFAAGDAIIREGEIGDEMFIVLTGGVEVRKRTRAGDDYTVVRLAAEQNVFFGELGLIDEDRRSATVIASRNSSFLVIGKKDFLDFGDRHPQIAFPITLALSRILCARLRKTTEDMLTIFDALVSEIQG